MQESASWNPCTGLEGVREGDRWLVHGDSVDFSRSRSGSSTSDSWQRWVSTAVVVMRSSEGDLHYEVSFGNIIDIRFTTEK